MTELNREFYRCDGLELAEKLIGKTLVHRVGSVELCGVIAETEAYMGVIDRASHAFGGRRTARTETMYLEGGYAYVYLIYGMYSCMNITAGREGNPEAVLLRAVLPWGDPEPFLEQMRRSGRGRNLPQAGTELTPKGRYALTNGPGKLCRAMGITREDDRRDMLSDTLFVRDDGWRPGEILRAPRIGIDYAGEARDYPWRFTAGMTNGAPDFYRISG